MVSYSIRDRSLCNFEGALNYAMHMDLTNRALARCLYTAAFEVKHGIMHILSQMDARVSKPRSYSLGKKTFEAFERT